MTKPIARDPIYRKRAFDADHHRVVRALVHHLSAVVSRSCGDDGRARRQSCAFDDPSVGHSLRSGVREALEPILASRWHVVASR
jgi:hypothetical protein